MGSRSPTWSHQWQDLDAGRGIRLTLQRGPKAARVTQVFDAWQHDARFRTWFTQRLAQCPFPAFRWENPPLRASDTGRTFECVLLDSPWLDRTPQPEVFAEHFPRPDDGRAGLEVICFANLGGDANMVVPCPLAEAEAYPHLAAFCRRAPASQHHALWQQVAAAMHERLGERPVWLSTAGAGVAWLHVRLDDQPKYYGHAPYRRPPGNGD